MATVYRNYKGTNNGTVDADLEGPSYLGAFARTKCHFAYEGQCMLWPYFNGSAPTTQWAKGSGASDSLVVPTGVLSRGLYEVIAYGGVQAWLDDIVDPNVDAWIAWMVTQGYTDFSTPLMYAGDLVLDLESWPRESAWLGIEGAENLGHFTQFKALVGGSDSSARTTFERTCVALQNGIVARIRASMPKVKIGDLYLHSEALYQMNDTEASGSTVVTGTSRTRRAEFQHQRRGTSPLTIYGGTCAWMRDMVSVCDWFDCELYAKLGKSVPGGGSGLIEPQLAAFYYKLHIEEMRRTAALCGKPMRVWVNPRYANGTADNDGLNSLDAQLLSALVKDAGASFGLWYEALGTPGAANIEGAKAGIAALNPHVKRFFAPAEVEA